MRAWRRIEPNHALVHVRETLQPDRAGLFVPVLDRTARIGDFVWTHRRVADEDDAIVARIFVQHVPRHGLFVVTAAIVLPHALIEAIVEVEEFEALELRARGGKK